MTPDVSRLAFVVGTGRCGSTLLGDLLGAHPAAVTINELLTAGPEPLADEVTSGLGIVERLSRPHPVLSLLLRHRIEPSEFRYPIDRPGARFTRATGVPGLLAAAIPSATASADAAWDELCGAAAGWPPADGSGHVSALARWFARRWDASIVIERSGGSLRLAPVLVERFPAARFVHLHRAGHDTARSMARHPFFQLDALRLRVLRKTGHDVFDGSLPADARAEVEALVPGLVPWAFDPHRFRARPPVTPVEFGLLWSSLLHRGVRALRSLPSDQVLHVDYAALCAAPARELRSIAGFLGLVPEPGWLADAAMRVRAPRSRDRRDDRLVRACAPGEAVRRSLRVGAPRVPAHMVTGGAVT